VLALSLAAVEGLPDGLGQVLGQIPDALVGVRGSGEDTLHVHLFTEAQHVEGFGVLIQGVEGFVPGGQDLARAGVEVAGLLVPDGQVFAVEAHFVGLWPPHLVVGGCARFCMTQTASSSRSAHSSGVAAYRGPKSARP
jgi:hypothetical protein